MSRPLSAFDKLRQIAEEKERSRQAERAVLQFPEPEKGTPEKGTPIETVPDTGAPQERVPFPVEPLIVKTPRIRRAMLAQDGHSFGEQVLYDAMWKHARPYNENSRIITVGYRTMSEIAQLTVNNCKANAASLAGKLAIEEVGTFSHTHGRTYLVHSFSAIIQRRRTAGLTHYVKTRGVNFVHPETGQAITGVPERGVPLSESGIPERDESGVPESGEKGIPDSGGNPYRHLVSNSEKERCPFCNGNGECGTGTNRSACGSCKGTGKT